MKLLLIFIILNIVNVALQTFKSIATIKYGNFVAAIINAIAYGIYTIVLVYMSCDLPLFTKAFVVAICNLIGVFLVKSLEEKFRKDKLWKIEATIRKEQAEFLAKDLSRQGLSFNNFAVENGRDTVFNIYCPNQNSSLLVKTMLNRYGAKYFVSETKIL